jgi:hypothetical protein
MNFLGLTGKAIAATIDEMREVNHMANKEILDKLSIYIPQKKMEEKPVDACRAPGPFLAQAVGGG